MSSESVDLPGSSVSFYIELFCILCCWCDFHKGIYSNYSSSLFTDSSKKLLCLKTGTLKWPFCVACSFESINATNLLLILKKKKKNVTTSAAVSVYLIIKSEKVMTSFCLNTNVSTCILFFFNLLQFMINQVKQEACCSQVRHCTPASLRFSWWSFVRFYSCSCFFCVT